MASSSARPASAVDAATADAAAPRLRALLATTFRWSSAARLAVDLDACGYEVHAVAPPGSALHDIAAVERSYPLGLIHPADNLRQAIERSGADVILPFDDRTRRAIHQVYIDADPATAGGARIRDRIVHSLGPPEFYRALYSRVTMMEIAAECGVRCPPTAAVRSADDVRRWQALHPGPAVLKTDGSWGGRGVRVIRHECDVRRAWRHLSRPPGLARSLKRLLVERDATPLRARLTRQPPSLSIQAFVTGGHPGNVAVACHEGTVLGAVQAAVIASNGPTGASTVVAVVEHPEMLAAARAMVSRLRLSGLVGLDFILEEHTGRAHLIEVNPRATPTSHLVSAEGTDLLTSLRSGLGFAGPPPRTASYRNGQVALFPQELERDPGGAMLSQVHHDVPWHAPDLVEHALAETRTPHAAALRARLEQLAGSPPEQDDERGTTLATATTNAPAGAAAPSSAPS